MQAYNLFVASKSYYSIYGLNNKTLSSKVTCSMQEAMKLPVPSIINDCKYILVFTFIVIEWFHYCFLGFHHCFIYIAHSCFSFPIHQTKYMNKRSHNFGSIYVMIPIWRHKNNFCNFIPLSFLKQLVLAPFIVKWTSFSNFLSLGATYVMI